jgi:hypothetical protein
MYNSDQASRDRGDSRRQSYPIFPLNDKSCFNSWSEKFFNVVNGKRMTTQIYQNIPLTEEEMAVKRGRQRNTRRPAPTAGGANDSVPVQWNQGSSDEEDPWSEYESEAEEEKQEKQYSRSHTFLTPAYTMSRSKADVKSTLVNKVDYSIPTSGELIRQQFGLSITFVNPVTLERESDNEHGARVNIWQWMVACSTQKGGIFGRTHTRVVMHDVLGLFERFQNSCAMPSLILLDEKVRLLANAKLGQQETFESFVSRVHELSQAVATLGFPFPPKVLGARMIVAAGTREEFKLASAAI